MKEQGKAVSLLNGPRGSETAVASAAFFFCPGRRENAGMHAGRVLPKQKEMV